MLIFRLFFIAPFIFLSTLAFGAASITITPSTTEMSPDEEVQLQFKVSVDKMNADIGEPKFDAPDFDTPTDSYSAGTNLESSFSSEIINGSRSQRAIVERSQITMVTLHPKKQGRLIISNIHATVDGKVVNAPDVIINVSNSLSQQGKGEPPHTKRPSHEQKNFFLKTEPSKRRIYKREQIILSYVLYTQVNILGIETERFPTVPGFLKEDIDIPIMRAPLMYTPATINRQEYSKALLAQYAIYPVQEGTLTIDPLVAKFSYHIQTRPRFNQNDDDVFGIFNRFFQAAQTTTELKSSDPVNIEVLPLPEKGKPQNFSGLVGDFDIATVVDKTSLKVGEPLNVKVKVEGSGHAGSLERLNVTWPKDFDLYEDKAESHFMKTGLSERLFDFVLIPKIKGSYEIPAIEVSMFNPKTETYQIKKSQPIPIEVLEGTLGNIYIAKTGSPQDTNKDIHYWMESIPQTKQQFGKTSKILVITSLLMVMLSLWSVARSKEADAKQTGQKQSKIFLEKIHALPQSSKSTIEILAEIENGLRHLLEFKYGILLGSLTREELRHNLKERGVKEIQSKTIENLLEQCENLRFSPNGSDHKSAKILAHELVQLVEKIY